MIDYTVFVADKEGRVFRKTFHKSFSRVRAINECVNCREVKERIDVSNIEVVSVVENW